jgi:predicted permease
MGAYRTTALDVARPGRAPVRLEGAFVTSSFFDVFGVAPSMGRLPRGAPGASANGPELVLSDAVWRQQFDADRSLMGSVVDVNGLPHTISAVMPPGFAWPINVAGWAITPLPVPPPPLEVPDLLAQRELRYFDVVASLVPAATPATAAADLDRVMRTIGDRFPISRGRRVGALPLHEDLVGDVRSGLLLLLAAVLCVHAVASMNVAGLLLARGVSRAREIQTRVALGATRTHIVRQFLFEGLLLALAGLALGALLATWGTGALVAIAAESIPRLGGLRVDGRVLLAAGMIAGVAGLLAGLVPALRTSRIAARGSSRPDGGRPLARVRMVLVASQLGLAVMLVGTAGLLVTSFSRLSTIDHGLEPSVSYAPLTLAGREYGSASSRERFYTRLLERLEASPATRNVALVYPQPFAGAQSELAFELESAAPVSDGDRPVSQLAITSPGAFRVLGIPLRLGRDFGPADSSASPAVVLVNEAFTRRYWRGADPIGRRLTFDRRRATPEPTWHTVVGVVADSRARALDTAPAPTVYFPYRQFNLPFATIIVRGENPAGIASTVTAQIRRLDPALPAPPVQTLAAAMRASMAPPRLRAILLAAFAGLTLALAGVGLYGLVSLATAQRRKELALRTALGAAPVDLARAVTAEALRATVAGMLVGAAGAVLSGRLIRTLLFDVEPLDPWTYTVSALVLASAVTLACVAPVRRAVRAEPMEALRSE